MSLDHFRPALPHVRIERNDNWLAVDHGRRDDFAARAGDEKRLGSIAEALSMKRNWAAIEDRREYLFRIRNRFRALIIDPACGEQPDHHRQSSFF